MSSCMKTISRKPTRKKPSAISLRELKGDEISSISALIRMQNPWMTAAQFKAFLAEMLAQNYRAVGAFDGDKLVGCSGFWLRVRFWCGRQLDVDNFIVHPDYRRAGIGKKMMAWLEKKAAAEKCQLIVLDTYVTYTHAQRFYLNEGYALTGYHVTKMPGSKVVGALPFSAAK